MLTKSRGKHLDVLDKVFTGVEVAGVKINPAKCYNFPNCVEYLGHVLSYEGAQPNPQRVLRAILEASWLANSQICREL